MGCRSPDRGPSERQPQDLSVPMQVTTASVRFGWLERQGVRDLAVRRAVPLLLGQVFQDPPPVRCRGVLGDRRGGLRRRRIVRVIAQVQLGLGQNGSRLRS